jgi:hypothetical protein
MWWDWEIFKVIAIADFGVVFVAYTGYLLLKYLFGID